MCIKKNQFQMEARREIEISSYVDESIVCTIVKKGVHFSIFRNKEKNDMTMLFHIKI